MSYLYSGQLCPSYGHLHLTFLPWNSELGQQLQHPIRLGEWGSERKYEHAPPMELELSHPPMFSTQQVAKLSESIEINTQKNVTTLTVCLFVLGGWNGFPSWTDTLSYLHLCLFLPTSILRAEVSVGKYHRKSSYVRECGQDQNVLPHRPLA